MEASYASGWFGVGFVDELRGGAVLARTVNGQELVLYRTASGDAVALDAYCPHLGAHLGHVGEVVGDELRCGFHGFCFDREGDCTRTGYGKRVPPTARLKSHPLMDFGGVLAVWHDPEGAAPTWTPKLPERDGWVPARGGTWTFPGRPQEIAENSVDLGHLSITHGYGGPTIAGPVRYEGPLLRVDIDFERVSPAFAALLPTIKIHAEIHQWGVGLACVDSHVPALGFESRFLVSSAAVDAKTVALRVASSVRSSRHNRYLGVIGTGLTGAVIDAISAWTVQRAFLGDVAQDLPMWRHKKYLERPALAEGDGPIGRYRQWARQFYAAPKRRLAIAPAEAEVESGEGESEGAA